MEAHEVKSLTQKEIWEYVESIMIAYLEVSFKFSKLLTEEIGRLNLKNETDAANYTNKLIRDYKQKCKNNFKYVPLFTENENSDSTSIIDIISKSKSGKFRIIGLAGMGKTTTLEYLAYEEAEEKVGSVPVVIELKKINDVNNGILNNIKNILKCSDEVLEKLLSNGFISLYLDGINEIILSEDEKKIIVSEIDMIIARYPKVKVVTTDRETTSITISENVNIITIQQLSEKQIKEFIDGNCSTPELKENVTNLLFSGDDKANERRRAVGVPFMLHNLIEIVRINGTIPDTRDEFTKNFIEAILKREAIEKNSPEAMNISIYLTDLVDIEKVEYTRFAILQKFGNLTEKFHLSEVRSDKLLDLCVQLHLLEETDFGVYRFSDDNIREYFLLKKLESE